MANQRTRRAFLGAIGATAVGFAGYTVSNSDETDAVMIFHAGSLAPPFSTVEGRFERETGAEVRREPKGSVASTKKITQQGRRADVLGVSDFRLLRDRLLPDYGSWYSIFATNALAIQYHEGATGARDITIGPGTGMSSSAAAGDD